ncbi:MAG: NEW3 domain-containing protein [Anaerolineae bacterium]
MRKWFAILLALLLVLPGSAMLAYAQSGESETGPDTTPLLLFTDYPSQVIGFDETASLSLKLRTGTEPQIVELSVENLPEGWNASFRGGGKVVHSAFVQPGDDTRLDLRVEPPVDVEPGTYSFVAVARSERHSSELPIQLTIQERVPASLSFEVELPVLRARSDSTFRYTATLRNEGDEDLVVNLRAEAPPVFAVTFKSSAQEVTTLPVKANSSERLTVEVKPLLNNIRAGNYPVTVIAEGGETMASIDLTAEITGLSALNLTTPDQRLSGELEAGKETTVTLMIQNSGTAMAHSIDLSATAPNGWEVTFEPEEIETLEAGEQVEVTAHITPAEKALSGDYMLTFRARPQEGASTSMEYRVTVRTSTVWGIVGIALIAVAVGAVGLAVTRFGRR